MFNLPAVCLLQTTWHRHIVSLASQLMCHTVSSLLPIQTHLPYRQLVRHKVSCHAEQHGKPYDHYFSLQHDSFRIFD